ncbi:flagellar hook-associated protein FlgK [Rhodothermus profundi]|uniref:Flagellar hook-associated protein 1 n=1 Tax=Rhodothermus profundi TaxID=633813 RepID=A0A1M6QDP3_9BACT|nr:flagellar hook-associated protein FlgK [Rhodothermus profundi]SHK18298.1 flagellar hook-associated protein 1 FlgK [Rhodothermus profundi]
MSLNQLFSLTRRSFQTIQAAMNTIGQNVANANTEGYARRRVTLQAVNIRDVGLYTALPPRSATGMGVSVAAYERLRDHLLDVAAWEARASLGASDEETRILQVLEGMLAADSESGLPALLNDFWNRWTDLANHPTDTGVREALRGQAQTLVDTFRRLARNLETLTTQTTDALRDAVDQANSLLQELASLNATIQAARQKGNPDLVAEDRRDQLVHELAELLPVQVQTLDDGSYQLTVNGMALVQGDQVMPLTLNLSGSTPTLTFGNTGIAFQTKEGQDGRIGAQLRLLTNTIPDVRQRLDTLAATLVNEINNRHTTGYGLDGGTGRPFFDPAGTTAATIALSSDVLNDSRVIAASGDPTAPGDNSVALQIAGLRDALLFNGGTETAETYAINLAAGIGTAAKDATSRLERSRATVDHLDALQQGVMGVSLDEELTNMIRFQQAYAATARVLDTARTMMDTLLNL